MSSDSNNFWFPAKTYGWGWGLPVKWQGWVVIIAYIALVTISGVMLDNLHRNACFGGLTIVMVYIFWLKGEKPPWRMDKNS